MNDFERGFQEELEKLSAAAPYSLHYREPKEEEVEEIKKRMLLRQLIGSGVLTGSAALTGGLMGSEMGRAGKGALIGAGVGAGLGGALTAASQLLPVKRIFELEDPEGAYGSAGSRFLNVPVAPHVIRSEGGEPEVL